MDCPWICYANYTVHCTVWNATYTNANFTNNIGVLKTDVTIHKRFNTTNITSFAWTEFLGYPEQPCYHLDWKILNIYSIHEEMARIERSCRREGYPWVWWLYGLLIGMATNRTLDRICVGAGLGGDQIPNELKITQLRFGILQSQQQSYPCSGTEYEIIPLKSKKGGWTSCIRHPQGY